MRTVVRDTELAAAAAMFPPVAEHCNACNGQGLIVTGMDMNTDPPSAVRSRCGRCEGVGSTLREMTKREEHHYLMILVQEKADAD